MALVETTDLIDNRQVATLLGLKHITSVTTYLARYPDMPRPVVDASNGRIRLWSKAAVTAWRDDRTTIVGPPEVATDASEAVTRTRERLIDAATELFLEKGYGGATVQEVAEHAGLTTGAIYSNFGGKGELLAQSLERRATNPYDTVGWSGATESDQLPALDDLIDLWLAAITKPAEPVHRLTLEAWVAAIHDEGAAKAFFSRVSTSDRYLVRAVEESRQRGELPHDVDSKSLLTLGRLLIMGAIASKALGFPLLRKAEARAMLERLTSVTEI